MLWTLGIISIIAYVGICSLLCWVCFPKHPDEKILAADCLRDERLN